MPGLRTSIVPCIVGALLVALALGAGAQPPGVEHTSDAPTGGIGGLGGGGAIGIDGASARAPGLDPSVESDCIPASQRARINALIADYYERFGEPVVTGATARTAVPHPYSFYPIGATLWRDVFVNNFVDLDGGITWLDWDCTTFAYNGHNGHDTLLKTFGEQDVGVPVFAALDGVVVARDDGHFDKNTSFPNPEPANFVILDHGAGHQTWYYHLRNGSVAVALNDFVRAGQQLGLTASSGNSNWPHLHFETRVMGSRVEPYAGPCNVGTSGWLAQTPIRRDTYLGDAGVTYEDMNPFPGPPFEFPRSSHVALSDPVVYFWIIVHNQPAFSTWRLRYKRPNGTTAFDSGTNSLGPTFFRWAWRWWGHNIADMHTIPGTWTVLFDLNGQTMVQAPVEVLPARDDTFNRAPGAVTLTLDPALPESGEVVFVRVNTSLVLDDPDWDIVRYEYVWEINDVEVRRVTSAGHADALARDTAPCGSTLRCTVTPMDGALSGPPVILTYQFPVACPDLNGDDDVDTADLGGLLGSFGDTGEPGEVYGDLNCDGVVDTADLGLMLGMFGGTCG